MKAKNFAKITLVASCLAVAACNKTTENNSSSSINVFSSTNENDLRPVQINSLKEGILFINGNTNYTFDISLNGYSYYSVYFTSKYVGTDDSSAKTLDLYCFDGTGIFSINMGEEDIISGEYYKNESGELYTDLYSNEFIPTMFDVSNDYVDSLPEDANEIEITNKKFRIQMIQCIGISAESYLSLTSFKAKFEEGKVIFDIEFGDSYKYKVKATNFGSTTNKHYNSFINKKGKVFTPSADLLEVRRLFNGDNFARLVYDFDYATYTSDECFHPHYFYTKYMGSSSISGYMSMNQKANEDHPDMDLHGCYMFTTNEGIPSFMPQPLSTDTDMTVFLHYPKYMDLMKKLQYLYEGSYKGINYNSPKSKKYYTTNNAIIENFAKNMSLDASWDTTNYPPVALALEVDLAEADVDTAITFHYMISYNKQIVDYPMPFHNFGGTAIEGLDVIYDMFND